MRKIDYIRRQPGIGDYNTLVEAINRLIDKAQEKKELISISIEREVKDYSFFLGDEVDLPFEQDYVLITPEDATKILETFSFSFKEAAQINDAIIEGKIVSLKIKAVEKATEKEKKQEAIFEIVEAAPTMGTETKPKNRGRKKKTSWN